MNHQALAIIDTEKCFMPLEEGLRLDNPEGFGELGVPGGEKVVGPINELTETFVRAGLPIVTTQEAHPQETAHFATDEAPNYVNTWPVHGVAGTAGAELHPELLVEQQPSLATRFIKGDASIATPEEDSSYTGALAHQPETGQLLPANLREQGVETVYVVGLAIGDGNEHKLCVDSTAVDLKQQGFDVVVVTDATEAVLPENRQKCFKNLGKLGIRLLLTAEARAEIEAAHTLEQGA